MLIKKSKTDKIREMHAAAHLRNFFFPCYGCSPKYRTHKR